jgi:hypothetical protein
MARAYKRDSRGRFAGGGSAAGRRQLRAKVGGSVTAGRLKRNAATGTAKPSGTVSGTRMGRSVDQFSREMRAMTGRNLAAKVKSVKPSLRQQAKAAGLRTGNRKAGSNRLLQDGTFVSSAPKGTIPRRDPSAAISPSDSTRRTLKRVDGAAGRSPRRSKATAARAAAAEGVLVRGEARRLKRSRGAGTMRRR